MAADNRKIKFPMIIHLKKPFDWKGAYIHLWDYKNSKKSHTKWPGKCMKPGRDGWYSYEVKGKSEICLVLNDGNGKQTEDYYLDKKEAWFADDYLWSIHPDHFRNFTFPDGLMKALVMSYDDGVIQDIRLARMFTKYGIKGTFHINSGIMENSDKVPQELAEYVYRGHEPSMHSSTHPFLYHATEEHIRMEIHDDKQRLEKIFNRRILGMSYPFGSYNITMLRRMREWGLLYGRVVPETKAFSLPGDLLRWRPSCHHHQAQELTRKFLAMDRSTLSLFTIWGHSWEFDDDRPDNNWRFMESICKQLSGHSDVWYASMGEIACYLTALAAVRISEDCKTFENESTQTVWVNHGGKGVPLSPGQKRNIG
jgi:peptidoglycan-N-acetylglucosamine deacetylase